jgi:rhamnosyltransferase subunit B
MAESAPEFLFESVGSHGDVMPLLSIAGELVRRGHRCQLLANEHFRAEASARGVGFHSTTSRRTHVDTPGTFVSGMYDGFEGVHEYFGAPGAFDEHTVVVSTHALSSCEPPAEAHRLRTVRLILSPIRIRSLLAPPWPLGARAQGPDGERFLKVTLPAMRHAADRHPEVLARMNDVRARVGLPPVRTSAHEGDHVIAQAALFPDWFGMPAKDWPTMECVGFPLPHSPAPLPPRVLEFLERHPRPLVFTTGTGAGKPASFFEAAARCCAELGTPGIFLSPFLSAEGRKLGARIAHFDHVELEALLPRVQALVHHGGIGTIARALQAGIPQIICPMTFDQPDNGHRIEVLGAGRVVERTGMSGRVLAAALRELRRDRELAPTLARFRAALAAPDAVARAAELLQRAARSPLLLRGAVRKVRCSVPGRYAQKSHNASPRTRDVQETSQTATTNDERRTA